MQNSVEFSLSHYEIAKLSSSNHLSFRAMMLFFNVGTKVKNELKFIGSKLMEEKCQNMQPNIKVRAEKIVGL